MLTYSASDMVLAVHSDAGYHSEPKAHSRAGGNVFLSTNADITPNNGAILNIAKIIKAIISYTAEAELRGLLRNAK